MGAAHHRHMIQIHKTCRVGPQLSCLHHAGAVEKAAVWGTAGLTVTGAWPSLASPAGLQARAHASPTCIRCRLQAGQAVGHVVGANVAGQGLQCGQMMRASWELRSPACGKRRCLLCAHAPFMHRALQFRRHLFADLDGGLAKAGGAAVVEQHHVVLQTGITQK